MIEIDENAAGQRIDNFLFRVCKGVPKSHIYRILRSGEVRVNKGRIDALIGWKWAISCACRLFAPRNWTKPIAHAPVPSAEFPNYF